MLDTQSGGEKAALGQVSAEGGQAAYVAIQRAVELCLRGDAVALATAPINKEALRKAGVPYLDYTEALTGLTGARSALTLFATWDLRLLPDTPSALLGNRRAYHSGQHRGLYTRLRAANAPARLS